MEKFGQMIAFEQQAAEFYKSGTENSVDEGIKKIFTTLMNNDKVHLKLLNDLITKGNKFEIDEEDFDSSLFSCLDDCGCAKLRAEELATYVSASDMVRVMPVVTLFLRIANVRVFPAPGAVSSVTLNFCSVRLWGTMAPDRLLSVRVQWPPNGVV